MYSPLQLLPTITNKNQIITIKPNNNIILQYEKTIYRSK